MTDEELIRRLRDDGQSDRQYVREAKTVLGAERIEAADRIEALVKEKDKFQGYLQKTHVDWEEAVARAERLEATVIAAAKIGQIVGFLGEDEGRIEAFREACGPELWAKALAALKGDNHV